MDKKTNHITYTNITNTNYTYIENFSQHYNYVTSSSEKRSYLATKAIALPTVMQPGDSGKSIKDPQHWLLYGVSFAVLL